MKSKIEIGPDEEIRGFKLRLYPDDEQRMRIGVLSASLKGVWNTLVKMREDHNAAVAALAVREKLVGPRPIRASLDGLSPDESKRCAAEHRAGLTAWFREVRQFTKDRNDCRGRGLLDLMVDFGVKHDYQALKVIAKWHGNDIGAHVLQHMAKSWFGSFVKGRKPARFKRFSDPMPVGVRSGECFILGEFGPRGDNATFYNCAVKINGMTIKGRLPGMKPQGRILQGVSIVVEPGGQWHASIKVVTSKRILPAPIPGSVIGIDVGLDNLAAIANATGTPPIVPERGILISNPRNRRWDERIELLRDIARDTGDARFSRRATREEQRAARRVTHIIYNDIMKSIERAETIVLEELNARIGQMGGSRMPSAMRTIRNLIVQRFGDRVREVQPAFTSQDCSHCGFRSKETWSYDHGAMGVCPSCGHFEHRDLNAARNIANKYSQPLKKTA